MSSGSVPPAPGGDRPRRRLGPGLTAFLVVDVVLVVTFVVLAVSALGEVGDRRDRQAQADAAATASAPPAEESPDATAPADAEDARSLEGFVLPSGNIWCVMDTDEATCTILSIAYERPEPREGCDVELGQVITVTADGDVRYACEKAERPPADLPELDYGEGSTIGEMSCLSSRNGAHCRHDPSGGGFTVARAGVTIFDAS